jgi:hypothetical protein
MQCLHYKPVSNHFCSGVGGGEGYNPLVEVTVNSKEENSCPNYVQEVGLWTESHRFTAKNRYRAFNFEIQYYKHLGIRTSDSNPRLQMPRKRNSFCFTADLVGISSKANL